MNDTDIVVYIKKLLKEKNWSNYRLAKESNLSKEAINKMLREGHNPSMNSLIKICKGFNMPLSQFFAEIENPNDEFTQITAIWYRLDESKKTTNQSIYVWLST
jgi:hypothetical protein